MRIDAVKAWRTALVVIGVLLLLLGAYVLVDTVKPIKIAGIALWFVLALIVHDGIIALVTFGVAFLLRKAGRTVPIVVLAIVQAGLVVMSILAIIVLPAVYKKSIGTKNPTVLPLDYGPALVLAWVVIVVITALAVVGYVALARRQKNRPSISQD
ncbi:hypothetical protein [Frigoribacterium sp. CG_9.8]|uniref:hypothetical protein n=1 Tax=Frigoribacterium sp. CG_9.8 TaxID=2787733 RepID=UPI0018CBDAA5|nr:hypothetical protein [Frigoribacterium sp. CG_9.8]MBG6108296.1 hypothetical protein [Frigoribacterium sp. CG_9.8]